MTCSVDPSSATCGACPPGYSGDGVVAGTGCRDVDECADPALVNGGCSPLVTCANVVGGRACGACPPGYVGDGTSCDPAADACATNNGGCDALTTCVFGAGVRRCGACPAGYRGTGETGCALPSACATNNGGCDALTTCADDGNGGSACGACPPGYDGDGATGCADRDACATDPCAPGVHCEDHEPPLTTRRCGRCPPGQIGDGETCRPNPCFSDNGGCDPSRTCAASASSSVATCGACPPGFVPGAGGRCEDEDGCGTNNGNCAAGELCVDAAAPATGRACVPSTGCAPTASCFLGATCASDGTTCASCPAGYHGDGATCTLCDVSTWISGSSTIRGAAARGRDTRVVAGFRAMDPACGGGDDGYRFRWFATTSDGSAATLDPDTTKSDTPALFLPKKTLTPGLTYALKLVAYAASNPAVRAETTFSFYVEAAPLTATIRGGDAVVVEGAKVTLDATASFDPDPDDATYDWKFTWRCVATTPRAGACLDPSGAPFRAPRVSAAVLENLRLAGAPGPAGQTYEFTLVASKGPRSARTTARVTVVTNPSPNLPNLPPPPSAFVFPLQGGTVNAGARARFASSVSSSAPASTRTLAWSATRAPIAGGASEAVDLTATNLLASTATDGAYLALDANAMARGYAYTFRLDVVDDAGAASAFATVAVNEPPAGGSVVCVPTSGVALTTTFRAVAEAWFDDDGPGPLEYRFVARVVGDVAAGVPDGVAQLQDFSPLAEFVGTLPGGVSSASDVVYVGVQARDAAGATSPVTETPVTVSWPTIASEADATAATTGHVVAAERALRAGGAETAMREVASACLQLEDFKRRRATRTGGTGAAGAGAACGATPSGDAATRASDRERMLAVAKNASDALAPSATLYASVADVVASILGDPCEATVSARRAGVAIVADNLDATETRGVTLGDEWSAAALDALSAAVTPVDASERDADAEAVAAEATRAARRVMRAHVASAVPGETPARANATMLSYVAARVPAPGFEPATGASASSALTVDASRTSFAVPGEALALGGTHPVDVFLLDMAYDAHAAEAAVNATAAAEGDVASSPRAAGTASLVLENATSGEKIPTEHLRAPIAFDVELDDGDGGAAMERRTCAAEDADADSDPSDSPPARAACVFWNETTTRFSDEGCATLPNPSYPGGTLAWAPEVMNGTSSVRAENASFAWTFEHPTALEGCELVELRAEPSGSETRGIRLRAYAQSSSNDATRCAIEDPANAARCHWRRDTQAFEGCGCVTTRRTSCACDHATDFTASAAPPRVKTISLSDLASMSLDDVANTWKVFAVVGGMFGCMMTLVLAFEIRDRRARRRILRKFIAGPTATTMAFEVLSDVWTWSIDVQEMQFMFNNLHHPNTAEAVAEVMKERFGDDEERVERELRAIVESRDYGALDFARAVERRKKALSRAARAKEGLPQVPRRRGAEGGAESGDEEEDPETRRIVREIDRKVALADVGIRLTTVEGKSRFESVLASGYAIRAEHPSDAPSDAPSDGPSGPLPRRGTFVRLPRPASAPKRKYDSSECEVDVDGIAAAKRNGPKFCANIGLKYVRFLVAFPFESLHRNLLMWKNLDGDNEACLPFDRAVGTAMVYAYLDVNNVVGHVEMASRIFDAAKFPWRMPTGVTFPLLVSEFKAMLSGNITGSGWMKRSTLWNIVALQNPDGHWNASDSLAGALRAAGPRQLYPPIARVNANPIIKSFYGAEQMLEECPSRLRACARRLGHTAVDHVWCTLLAAEGCKQAGMNFVLNPWDDVFHEFDIVQCGWHWIERRVNGDAEVAAAVLEAETHAERCVTKWRERFVDVVRGLHAMRASEERRRARAAAKKTGGVLGSVARFALAIVTAPWTTFRRILARAYRLLVWAVKLYAAAHMFFRAFLAKPTDAFTGSERVVMQTTMYLTSLLVTVWFYYNKASECCVIFRRDVGCSSDPLEACRGVPEGAGCAALMTRRDLKPEGWTCAAFPDKKNGWHFLTVVAIQIVIMFPVKFTLTKTFTEGGGALLEPHWRQAVVAAGMNLTEVYVAWLECLYQVWEDPVGVLRKPEIAAIIKRTSKVMKKTLMATLVHYAVFVVAAFWWALDNIGVVKKKKARMHKFQATDVIRGNIRALAMADETLVLNLKDDGDENETTRNEGKRYGAEDGDEDAKGEACGVEASGVEASRAVDVPPTGASDASPRRRTPRAERPKPPRSPEKSRSAQNISMDELETKRRRYFAKLRWLRLFMANLGWFLSMFTWVFCSYVIITYGVLIYRYLGPGEEAAYITTWGTGFLINTFGLESMKIIGRKAFFMLFIAKFKKSFMKAADALGWYETYTEMVGMHLLHETDMYDADAYRADDEYGEDDEGGIAVGIGGEGADAGGD